MSVGYDPEKQVLEVEFTSGVYQYSGVPQETADALMAAPSVGKYFHANIRNNYTASKIGG